MASASYGPVNAGKGLRDDEDGLVDEWGMRYEGHHKPGGGTFTRKKASARKRYLMIAAGIVISVVLIIILVVAVQKHTNPSPKPLPPHIQLAKYPNKTVGLTFFPEPEDGTVMIKWNVGGDFKTDGYGPYTNSLGFQMYDYQMKNQRSDKYADCTKNNTPADKICRFDPVLVKPCDTYDEYGYSGGVPCVMLKLNLPRNATAVPFEKDSDVAKMLGDRYSPDHIGVSCEGASEEDRKFIGKTSPLGDPIQYFPSHGFPAYWFRPRTIDEFLAPIVMVKFNTLFDSHYIHIKCTAWGKNFNSGKPQNSAEFTASFVFYHI